MKKMNGFYEVLSPWADADLIPFRGITPRLTDLAGKKIGLLRNSKRSAEPILNVAYKKLKEKFPTIEFSWYRTNSFSASAEEKERLPELEDWLKSVDAVIASVGD
jgi:hypothetical protein